MLAVFAVTLSLQFGASSMNACFSETANKACIRWSFYLQLGNATVILVALPLLFFFKPSPPPEGFFKHVHRAIWTLLLINGLIVACGVVMLLIAIL